MDSTVNWQERYNATHIVTVRLRLLDLPGKLAECLVAVGKSGAPIGDIRMVGADSEFKVRDVQIFFADAGHAERALDLLREVEGAEVLFVSNDALEIHRGGTIETVSRVPLETVMDLRMVYTPGVASVCKRIAELPEAAWDYTHKGNRIAIVTNGTAVLGLGDIGPLASLPVMEGKAAILAHYVGVSADPVLLDTKDEDEIVEIVAKMASHYGAIQLEDIAAPACFEIERRLGDRLDIPVFHDDQHGTATVCVAGLINALERTSRQPGDVRAVVLGAGAAGIAITRFLLRFGVADVVLCDSKGALYEGRAEGMNTWKDEIAKTTNRDRITGSLSDAMEGRNLFVGVSKPGLVSKEMVASMEDDSIVFALANPVSEIATQDALDAGAAVAIDGRGMNNALAYPGIFRGALDARARTIDGDMMLAAAGALADMAEHGQLLPDMLDLEVHRRVAEAVEARAQENRASG